MDIDELLEDEAIEKRFFSTLGEFSEWSWENFEKKRSFLGIIALFEE